MALARLEFFRIDGLAPSLTLSAAALLHMLNALPNQNNGRFSVLRKMSDSNGHTVVKRLLAVFKTAALPIRLNLPGAACLYFYIQNAYWTLGPCGMLSIP